MRRGAVNFPAASQLPEDFGFVDALVETGAMLDAPLLIADLTVVQASALETETPTPRQALLMHLAAQANLVERLESRSVALVPLRVEDTLLGILFVFYNVLHQFTPLEGRIYRVLTDLSGVALERTRLLDEAQRRLAQERWVRDFSEEMMRIPNLQMVMARAAQALQELVGADGVMISLEQAATTDNASTGEVS
jgi:GAF domain-containing protein